MKLSVLIPTFQRPAAIDRCLAALSEQRCGESFEILVGIDGEDTPTPTVPAGIVDKTKCVRLDRVGLIGVRRALVARAKGEIVLWLNDDSYAQPGLLDAHLRMHCGDGDRVVGGAAEWKPIAEPDVFDAMVQRTDLIFFQPKGGGGAHRTDYRNCFGLNMSFPRELGERVGGVAEVTESYGYEDLEFVHRMVGAGAHVWHTPEALVVHDHRYRPADVHRREYLLGRAAWQYAKLNPGFAMDLFKRDIGSEEELAYIRASLVRERTDAERVERSFLALDGKAVDGVDEEMLGYLVEHWVLLKRYLWRWGVLDAASGEAPRWSLVKDRDATGL